VAGAGRPSHRLPETMKPRMIRIIGGAPAEPKLVEEKAA
jgi:hypothetical protein